MNKDETFENTKRLREFAEEYNEKHKELNQQEKAGWGWWFLAGLLGEERDNQ